MKAKILYTQRALPLILEALGHELFETGKCSDQFIKVEGEIVYLKDIIGFSKGEGVIRRELDLEAMDKAFDKLLDEFTLEDVDEFVDKNRKREEGL